MAWIILVPVWLIFQGAAFCQSSESQPLLSDIHFGIFTGVKDYQDADIGNTKLDVGVHFDVQPRRWPVAIATEVFYSEACPDLGAFGPGRSGAAVQPASGLLDGGKSASGAFQPFTNCDSFLVSEYGQPSQYTLDLNLGLRKRWEQHSMQPFIGGGIALVHSALDSLPDPFEANVLHDWTRGHWIGAGLVWRADERAGFGFELRYSRAKTHFLGRQVDLGGLQVGFVLEFFRAQETH